MTRTPAAARATISNWTQSFIAGSPIPQLVLTEDGRIVALSQSLTRATGLTHAEIPTVVDWLIRAARLDRTRAETLAKGYTAAPREGLPGPQQELDVFSKTGEQRHWLLHLTGRVTGGATDDGTCYFVWSAVDVTDRRQTEIELEANRQFIERIFRTNPDILYVFDLQLRATVYQNRHLTGALGYTEQEVERVDLDRLNRLLHADDVPRVEAHLARVAAAADDELCCIEYRLRHRDGSWRWFYCQDTVFKRNAAGEAVQLLGTATDITTQKATESELQENREALVQGEARYRAVVDDLPLLVCRFEANGEITFVNRAYSQYFRREPEDLGGMSWLAALPASERYAVSTRIAALTPDHPTITHEHQVLTPDASTRWHRWTHTAVFDRAGKAVAYQGFGHDITEERSARTERDALFQRNQALVQAVGEIVYEWRAEPDVVVWSGDYQRILGYSEDEIGDDWQSWISRLHPADRERAEAEQTQAEAEQRLFDLEYRLRHKSGDYVWVHDVGTLSFNDTGKMTGIVGIVRDISDRRRAEEELRATRQRLGYALQSANAAAWEWDAASNRMVWFSDPAPELGIAPGTAPDLDGWLAHVAPEDRNKVQEAFTRVLVDHCDLDVTYRLMLRDERHHWVRDVGKLSLDDRGKPATVFGIRMDITRHKALEARLQEASKLDAIGRLAGGIAHDLNNLLLPIDLTLDLCLDESPPSMRARLEIIREASQRAGALTRQILAFSSKQVLDVQALRLDTVVRSFVTMLARLIGEHIELVLDFAADGLFVRADRSQIEQVLLNLAVNARDAMPNGGTLTIRTYAVPGTDRRPTASRPDKAAGDPCVAIEVVDTGVGIDEATRAHIFEPFFTTKPRGEGTGLGLATVRGIAQQHGGVVSVRSTPGAGTAVCMLLPLAEGAANAQQAEPETKEPTSLRGTERILVVEDDENVRTLVSAALTNYGYHTVLADRPADALAVAASSNRFDLLLTDVIMPEMDGKQLYQQMTALRPELRVLFMSGYTDRLLESRGVLENGIVLLQKPFSSTQLLSKVREVLDTGQLG